MEALVASDNTQSTDGRPSSLSLAEPEPSVCLHVALPDGFSLPAAVCSYGFFMMAPTVWIPPRVSESTAQEGLGVKSEAEEAAGEPGSAEGGRREAGDGREGAEGSGTAERKGLDEEGERGSSGNAWGGGEQAWGAMERPLRLADGRAVMVRITQHGAADVTHHGAADVTQHGAADVTQHGAADVTHHGTADVTQHGAADVTQHCSADVTQHDAADVLERSSGDGSAGVKEEPVDALCDTHAPTAIRSATADAAAAGSGTRVAVRQGTWLRVRVMGLARITTADHAHLLVSPWTVHPCTAGLLTTPCHPSPPLLLAAPLTLLAPSARHALPSSPALTSHPPHTRSVPLIPRAVLPTRIAANLTCTHCRTSVPPAPALSPPLQAQVRRMLRLSRRSCCATVSEGAAAVQL
ncbi:unnamed protein product [Closterium sp. Naga37s-1]|nr:unnamed protein product [Closterium sp. Naga37s-1]